MANNLNAATLAPATAAVASAASNFSPGVALNSGAAVTGVVARDLGMVNGSIGAAAKGLAHVSPMQTAARFLSRTVAVVVVGASALQGAQILHSQGSEALYRTRAGRGAVLGTLGGSLMLMPFPPAQLGAAAVLAFSAANELGAFQYFDRNIPIKHPLAAGTGVTTALTPGSVHSLAAGAIA